MLKNNLKSLLFGVGVSILLIFFIFRDLDTSALAEVMSRIPPLYLVPLFLVCLSSVWVRSKRWGYLLPNERKIPMSLLFDATSIGILASWILPLRAGEFIRPWVLSKGDKEPGDRISFCRSLASVVVERIFDVIFLLLLVSICVSQIESVPNLIVKGCWALGVVSLALFVVILLAFLRGDWLLEFSAKILSLCLSSKPTWQEGLTGFVREFIEGLRDIDSLSELLAAIALSAVLWGHYVLVYYLGILCFESSASVMMAITTTVMVGLAIAAPSGPGFVGTFQAGCVLALSGIYGLPKELSVGYSVFIHATQVICGIAIGLYSMRRQNLTFSGLVSAASQQNS